MEQALKYISEMLKRQGDAISSPGLFHGKMGGIVFFFHYAKYTGDSSFEEYAMELMDSMQEQISQEHVINYADGLAGIGTGIEYLVQNHFVEADTNEVLEDFDKIIFQAVVYGSPVDVSLDTGLTGLGRYLLFRIAGCHANENHIGTLDNKLLLIHITDILERMLSTIKEAETEDVFRFLLDMNRTAVFPAKVGRILSSMRNRMKHRSQINRRTLYQNKYYELLAGMRDNTRSCIDLVPDLYGGLAGIGMYLLSELDKQHETWMKLL